MARRGPDGASSRFAKPAWNSLLQLIKSTLLAAAVLPVTVVATSLPPGDMTQKLREQAAAELMMTFAERTKIGQPGATRYLWTDAYAVCNFLGLAAATGEARYRELAATLIESVHLELAHHRADDPRSGWLSGPAGAASPEHPTRAGLRIGKPLPERAEDEPFNDHLEWERDGQYFHYLTRWMHALDRAAVALERPELNLWARELAVTAHRAFVYQAGSRARRMYWKMSIDLSRPQVPSMGQHDPLDGYVTARQLIDTASALGAEPGTDLQAAAADYARMLRDGGYSTSDPLGIGGLLVDAWRLAHLMDRDDPLDTDLLHRLLEAAGDGLRSFTAEYQPKAPAARRLAFRELGLVIGLAAAERLGQAIEAGQVSVSAEAASLVESLREQQPLRAEIESFWLDPEHRRVTTWTRHRDINEVMLATSLHPDGYLAVIVAPGA